MKKEHQALFYAMLSLVGTFSTLCNSVHCCRSKCYEMLEGNVRDKRADCDCNVQVYDGFDSSSKELTPSGGYRGNNLIPNTTFRSSGPVVFVKFTSSMVQTRGSFALVFSLGKIDFLLWFMPVVVSSWINLFKILGEWGGLEKFCLAFQKVWKQVT